MKRAPHIDRNFHFGLRHPGLGAALDRLWPGVAHQRCTVHKLRNLVAQARKHAHDAVREDYHRIVYAETREAAQQAHAAFLLKWKKLCPTVAASLEEAGEQLLTFYQFPASQHLYREAALKYEEHNHRYGTAKGATQAGHDIDSFTH